MVDSGPVSWSRMKQFTEEMTPVRIVERRQLDDRIPTGESVRRERMMRTDSPFQLPGPSLNPWPSLRMNMTSMISQLSSLKWLSSTDIKEASLP
jgi:hypothetical protein